MQGIDDREKGRRREEEKEEKGEGEVERYGTNFRQKRHIQRKSPEFILNSGLS